MTTREDREEALTLAEYALLGELYAAIVDESDDPARISDGARLSTRRIDRALGVTLDNREDGSPHRLTNHAGERFHHASAENASPQRRRTDCVEARDDSIRVG